MQTVKTKEEKEVLENFATTVCWMGACAASGEGKGRKGREISKEKWRMCVCVCVCVVWREY